MIKMEHVNIAYDTNEMVLKDINFSIKEGECIGLIGANGAGKSSLLKAMLGLIPYEGRIYVEDSLVEKKNLASVRKTLGFLFQNADEQMFMPTVYEDMAFGLLNMGLNKDEVEKRIDDVLKELRLDYLKKKYNHKLSIGEKRMAAIATILAMQPKVLLMDEPTSALDPKNRRLYIDMMNGLKMTKIITSHDLDMIYSCCERVIVLGNGKLQADGGKEDILRNKKVLEENHLELPLAFQRL
ncbi:MAG: ABC transporter ATP-binding protein [Solobacterium sp.]|nr:ABC transporter ATP-binding protein [Solobacterium sp.]